jgi:hypothetical protein
MRFRVSPDKNRREKRSIEVLDLRTGMRCLRPRR